MGTEITCRKWKPLMELGNLKLDNVLHCFKEIGMFIPGEVLCVSITNAFSIIFTAYYQEINGFLRVNINAEIVRYHN